VSVEEKVDCYATVLEEVPIFELENQKEVEMEGEDDDIEVVWEDEEPTCGNILKPSCINILENPCALVETTFDTRVDDSLSKCNNDLYSCDTNCFYFRLDDSIGFVDNFTNECENLDKDNHVPYKDDSLCIDISTTYDYDCFNFWEDDSIVKSDIVIDNHKDSPLFNVFG